MKQRRICLIKSGTDGVCGRPVHAAPPNTDASEVCLSHSRDPNKRSGILLDQFNEEIWEILKKGITGMAENNLVSFDHVIFPDFNLYAFLKSDKPVTFKCTFRKAVFEHHAYFGEIVFTDEVDFADCEFREDVGFTDCVFGNKVTFCGTTFSGKGFFQRAHFDTKEKVDFSRSRFRRRGLFKDAKFFGPVDFSRARFLGADFSGTYFAKDLSFKQTHFHCELNLEAAQIDGCAKFEATRICGKASFKETRFEKTVTFQRTRFRHDASLLPGPVFAQTNFAKPDEVHFYKTDLSHALFYNCDVSKIDFSSVKWRKRPNGNCMLLEEDLALEDALGNVHASALRTGDGTQDYGLIAQIYQQLKKNYDTHLDYWTADHFHYGEMEMQRRALPATGRLLKLRQRLHPRIGLAAFYRYASDYGNNYWKPIAWMVAILLFFTILFPVFGLQRSDTDSKIIESRLTYSSVWPSSCPARDNIWEEAKLLGRSLITTLDTATFQRSSAYTPVYPVGRIAVILEVLLTSTCFALFLLAIRRQFRR